MRRIPSDDVINLSISLYENVGESMTSGDGVSKMLQLYRAFNIVAMMIILVSIVANLFHVESGMYITTIEGSLTVIHTLVKYLMFLYYKCDLMGLLHDMLHFWNHQNLLHTKKLKEKIERIFKYVKMGQNSLVIVSLIVITALYLRPALSNKTNYIFHCWVPDSIVLQTIVLSFQYHFLSNVLYISLSYDLMYVSYAVHVIVQLRLLRHKLKHLATDYNIGNISVYVKHHQFLLSVFSRMNRVYFWLFLFHYFVTLITGCTQLYIILLRNVNFIDLVSTGIYIVALLSQFGYWSFLVEEIVFELSSISNSIYMSKWYEKDKIVKNMLLMMMMKAQKQKYMSAGGLMDMNIDAFGSVIRKIFSFYAVLKNLLNK